MGTKVSDQILERLRQWGVKRVFGYPGDGINGLIGAFGRAGDTMEFVQARHEELAAFMACAHARFTGEVGVCMATSGPCAIHLLNGLYDAKADHTPVVAPSWPAPARCMPPMDWGTFAAWYARDLKARRGMREVWDGLNQGRG
jgi:thiamine pyrophosphate-dependent acetolactate synthase large subunit-like protein